MTIGNRGAPGLLALLAGGACTSQTINLVSPPAGDSGPPADAAIDGVAADAAADAARPADAPGGCPELIDQKLGDCVSPPVTQCDGYGSSATTGGADAQVFTPVLGGAITRLRLWMRNTDPARSKVVVSIADLRGDPLALLDRSYSIEAHILATTLASMTGQFGWQEVAFSSPPTVLAGRPYAIYVRVASPLPILSSADWGVYNDYGHPTLDAYPGGGGFGFTSSGWIPDAVFQDFMFEVHLIPSSCP